MNNEYEERGYVTTQIMDENSATAIWHQLLDVCAVVIVTTECLSMKT